MRQDLAKAKRVFNEVSSSYREGWLKASRGVDGYIHRMQVQCAFAMNEIGPGSRVLDVGGGGGRWANEFASRGCDVVYADISLKMAEVARDEAEKEGVIDRISFVIADAQHLPFRPNWFHVAHSSEVIYYFPDRVQVLKESERVCKRGGIVICSMMNNTASRLWELSKRLRDFLGKDPYAAIEYKVSSFQLESEFKEAGLQDVRFRGFVFFPPL